MSQYLRYLGSDPCVYSSLRVHLCQEKENYRDVAQGIACRLALAEEQCSLGEPEQCPGMQGVPPATPQVQSPAGADAGGSLKEPCTCMMYTDPERMGLFLVIEPRNYFQY